MNVRHNTEVQRREEPPADLLREALMKDHRMGWRAYAWKPQPPPESRGPSGAGVATFARRLIAIERARLLKRDSLHYSNAINSRLKARRGRR